MSDRKRQSYPTKPGFTIVEMLIIAPIVILMIGAFVSVIVNLTGEVLASRSANVLAYNTQDALSRIETDVRLSTKFLAVNNITLASPQGYDNATGVFTNVSAANGNMLILEEPMTTGNPATSTGTALVRKDASLPCSDPNVTSLNTFMTMNVIYFVKTDVNNVSTLWRRTVVPADYVTNSCYTAPVTKPWQQPSCLTGTGGVCLTQDVRLLDITAANFNVQYFNTPSDTVANTAASDPAASDAARNTALQSTATVGVTLSVTKTAAGRDVSQSGTIRATRLNGGITSTAPANLAATSGTNQVSLTWTPPANNGGSAITGYKLYRATTANPTTLVQTLGNVTSYSDTGLVAGTTYYYRIIATNNVGDSPYSVQASATPTAAPVSVTFSYTGTVQTFTVPGGVTSITIECWGAGDSVNWGGGYATGVLVGASGTLNVYVGGAPVGGTGGWNGGGNHPSWPGRGASDVRVGGTALSDRVIVAGGEGGYGNAAAPGGGGGLSGQTMGSGGAGGTQTTGYALGIGQNIFGGGGAGGGGYWGGFASSYSNTAGGGGSGYVGTLLNASMRTGIWDGGNGKIIITY